MPNAEPDAPARSGGIHLGNVGGSVSFSALGDIVGGDKVVNITTTIQISVEAVTQRPLNPASPFRGLDRFEDRDKDLFFGRDQLIKSLLAELGGSNVLLVLGPSGSGKSSVVRAGLLPALARLLGASFRAFTLVPDIDPFESLRSSLQRDFSQTATRGVTETAPAALPDRLHSLQREGEQWVLFLDQFEELFTRTEERLRRSFIAGLLALIDDPAASIKVVIAMRADFLDRLGAFPDFARRVEKQIALVTELHADELRLAIEQPAGQHGVVFEPGLVDEIIKDVQGQAGLLPLLQYTLDLLWQEECRNEGLGDRHLIARTYRELGGVRGALQKRADEIYAGFGDSAAPKHTSEKQEVVRRIFLRLVDIAGTGADEAVWRPVRRRVAMATVDHAQEQELLAALIDHKLIVSNRRGSEATVEVAHEALFLSWERLKTWIEGGKQVIFVKNRLADDARRWHARRQEDRAGAEEELLGGSRLDQALDMLVRGDFVTVVGGLSETETQFLTASRALRDQRRQAEQKRQQRELEQARALADEQKRRADEQARAAARQRRLALGMVGVSLLTVAAAGYAWRQQGEAEMARREAEERGKEAARQLAEASWLVAQQARGTEYAGSEASPIKAAHYLWRAAAALESTGAVGATGNASLAAQFAGAPVVATLLQPVEFRAGAGYSPNGDVILTWSDDGAARLWRATDGHPLTPPLQHSIPVIGAAFSADGQRVLTWTGKVFEEEGAGEARLWRVTDGQPIGQPMKHANSVRGAAFSPNGQSILTWSNDGTARLWRATDGQPLGRPLQHGTLTRGAESRMEPVVGAVFGADGEWICTWSLEHGTGIRGKVRLWRASDGQPLDTGIKLSGRLLGVFADPRNARLLTCSAADDLGGREVRMRLWTLPEGGAIGQPMGHGSSVSGAAFDSEGARLLTWSRDGTARLWNAATGAPLGEPMKHPEEVDGATFSSDGKAILTWMAADPNTGFGEARLWLAGPPRADPEKRIPVTKVIRGARFSPDDHHILTWTGGYASGDKGEVRLWNVEDLRESAAPMIHETDVVGATFSPDGRRVLTWSLDGTTRIWDPGKGRSNRQIKPAVESIQSALLGPHGERLLFGSHDAAGDGRIHLYEIDSDKMLALDIPRNEAGQEVQLSPDGRRVLTWSDSGPVRLWDAIEGKPIGGPLEKGGPMHGAHFSPDNRRFVTWSTEGDVQLWDVTTREPLAPPVNQQTALDGVRFSPDGKIIVGWSSVNDTGELRLWRSPDGPQQPLAEQPIAFDAQIAGAAFSPDGRLIAAWSESGLAQVWRVADGQSVGGPIKHDDVVRGVGFSTDSQRLMTWCEDDRARVFRTADGVPLGRPLEHADDVVGAVFFAGDQRIMSWSVDGTVRLWGSDNHQCIAVFRHPVAIASACFNRTESQVIVVGVNGTVWRWDLPADETTAPSERALEFEVRSATTLGLDGQVRVLRAEEWEARKKQLSDLRAKRTAH